MSNLSRRFCVAPMIDCTDRHYRYLARLASTRALLFTEMITTDAILNGDKDYILGRHAIENPVALQLGGSDITKLQQACQIANTYGYDEINLNVGCPSDKVQNHMIGACLMAYPQRVRDCLMTMADASHAPVTIKHRTGLDDQQDYQILADFVGQITGDHCQTIYVHARNAYLQGLSPKQNREIPPLQYDKVYQLKRDFPHLEVIINGGIEDFPTCHEHLTQVDGVMLGRAAYHQSALLLEVDKQIFGTPTHSKMSSVIAAYISYMVEENTQGVAWHHMVRHLMGLCHGLPGARNMRRHISENMFGKPAQLSDLYAALNMVELPA